MNKDALLLAELYKKLHGKSVYKSLGKIIEGTADETTELKAMFSLGTHIVIEGESGDKRFDSLLRYVYLKIGKLLDDKRL